MKRSRRVYVYWSIALALLLAVGAFAWGVVIPVWRARTAVAMAEPRRPRRLYDEEAAQEAIEYLGGPEAAAASLAQYLRRSERWAPHRLRAVGLLGLCGPYGVTPLLELLDHDDVWVRRNAIDSLGRIRDSRAVEPLLAILRDRSSQVRGDAADALSLIKDPRAVEPLIAQLSDPEVQREAIYALGELGDPRATLPLARFMEENSTYRWTAAFALGRIGDVRAVSALLPFLKDEDLDVREEVAQTLGLLRDPRAVTALIDALEDKAHYPPAVAQSPDADRLAVQDAIRFRIVESLGKIGPPAGEAIPALERALQDKDGKVRQAAAEALKKIKAPSAPSTSSGQASSGQAAQASEDAK